MDTIIWFYQVATVVFDAKNDKLQEAYKFIDTRPFVVCQWESM